MKMTEAKNSTRLNWRAPVAALVAYHLAILPFCHLALADMQPPPSMLPDASNALLPIARNNLGIGAAIPVGVLYSSAGNVTAAGTVYVPGDTVTLAGGIATQQAILAITDTQAVAGTVAAAGSGGTNGACTVTGTTGTGTKAQFAGTISGGALTGPLTVAAAGDYTVNPTAIAAEPVTGCGLAGAQVAMTMGALKFNVQNPGNYSGVPASPVAQGSTTGSGTGASFPLSFGPIAASLSGQVLGSQAGGANLFIGGEGGSGTERAGGSNTTGGENTYVGDRAGGKATGSFNAAFGANALGIGGVCSTQSGGSNTALGNDSQRNTCGGSNNTSAGANSLYTQSQSGGGAANDITAVGGSSMQFLNTTHNSAEDTALGAYSCRGVNGSATFWNATCLGAQTGGGLSSANGFLILGKGVGNATFASGSGVILIGSGNVAVDTPAAGTSNYLNIENLIVADTSAGHFTLQNGSAPAVTAGSTDCGTSPAVSGNDNVGLVTVGSSTNGSKCTITFHTAWVTAPVCLALNQTTGNLLRPTSTTTTLTLNGTLTAADKLSFMCKGYAL